MRKLQFEQGDIEKESDVADALAFLGKENVRVWLSQEVSKQEVKDALTAQVRSAYESGAYGSRSQLQTAQKLRCFLEAIDDFLGVPWYGYNPSTPIKEGKWML
ncbi:hypothetical protein HDU93_005196 [Gonapodya sp. JEL0774]|nr:hypothetical protein HDU93_005196 [Gonapodya sp. JEL0774]